MSQNSIEQIDMEKPMSLFNFSAVCKTDLDVQLYDCQLNEPDEMDVEAKLHSLRDKQFNFKRNLSKKKLRILNLVEEQKSSMPIQPNQQQSLISNNSSEVIIQKENHKETLDTVNQSTLKRSDYPSSSVPHRFKSKKRSQFSYYSNDSSNIEVPLQDPQKKMYDSRKERSKLVRTTVKQLNQIEQQRLRLRGVDHLVSHSTYHVPQRNSQLSLFTDPQKDQISQHSVSPKSILKNGSSSSFSSLRIGSQLGSQLGSQIGSQLGSQLNSHSPTKKRVKFCLTKQQARRENIHC